MARPKPRTRYQRESAVLEIIGAIEKHATVIPELCAAAKILLGAPGEYVSQKWPQIDALIDKANGVEHLTPAQQASRDHMKRAGL